MPNLRGIPLEHHWITEYLTAQEQAVSAYAAKVDAIAARLYGLTDAERAIIEGRGE